VAGPPTERALEALLCQALAQPARVERIEPLRPWSVARCRVRLGDGRTCSVIAKWLREVPQWGGRRTELGQIATERAALEFLAEIGFARAPRLIAADSVAGVLVMEDLAPRTPLDERLRADGLAAMTAQMLDYARTLGELGAATAGRPGATTRSGRPTGRSIQRSPASGASGRTGPRPPAASRTSAWQSQGQSSASWRRCWARCASPARSWRSRTATPR
jgi:hypothetical protein